MKSQLLNELISLLKGQPGLREEVAAAMDSAVNHANDEEERNARVDCMRRLFEAEAGVAAAEDCYNVAAAAEEDAIFAAVAAKQVVRAATDAVRAAKQHRSDLKAELDRLGQRELSDAIRIAKGHVDVLRRKIAEQRMRAYWLVDAFMGGAPVEGCPTRIKSDPEQVAKLERLEQSLQAAEQLVADLEANEFTTSSPATIRNRVQPLFDSVKPKLHPIDAMERRLEQAQ